MSNTTSQPPPGADPGQQEDAALDQALAEYRDALREQHAPDLVGARIARAAGTAAPRPRASSGRAPSGTRRWLPVAASLAAATAVVALLGVFGTPDQSPGGEPVLVAAAPKPRLTVSYEPVPMRRLTPTGGHQIYYVQSRILRDERGLVRAVFPSRRARSTQRQSNAYGARPASIRR
ncbi:MAG: hypothetical protein AAF515_11270 [Pseudomonadota bacterium]